MAKKKTKKDVEEKLPKTIAGVKVPKELRTVGGKLNELAQTPLAQEVALAALAAAVAARKDARRKAKKAAEEAGEMVEDVAQNTAWIGAALVAAAGAAGKALLDAFEETASGANGGTGTAAKVGKVLRAAEKVAGSKAAR